MKSSNTNARTAVSGSTEFPWMWSLADLEKRPKHGHTVFSCFSCGGGSSMGYKLAGYDVVGNCEIDPDMMKVYKQNVLVNIISYTLFENIGLNISCTSFP